MTKQKLLRIAHIAGVVTLLSLPLVALGQFTNGDPLGLNNVRNTGLPNYNIQSSGNPVVSLIITVIKILLGIAGALAVLFVIIGGYQYLTSAGNDAGAKKGKTTVVNAVIGIVIIVLSYVIVTVVANLVSRPGSSGIGGGVPGSNTPGRP